jgi:hypothetical protein
MMEESMIILLFGAPELLEFPLSEAEKIRKSG